MKIHRSLFYLLLALVPTQLTKYFFPEFAFVSGVRVDYVAPVIYLTDLLLVAIAIFWFIEYVAARPWRAQKAAQGAATTVTFVAFALITLNILFAINPIITSVKWLRIIEAAFLAFYIIRTKPNVRLSMYYLLFAGFYSCVLAWMQFIQQSSIGSIFWWIGERTFTVTTPGIARTTFDGKLFLRPYATFPHPNVLAGFLTCLIPSIFCVRKNLQLLFVPVLILFLATILITFSQSAWIIALVITLAFVLKEKGIRLTKPAVLIGSLAFIAILALIAFPFVEQESIARRLALTSSAFSIMKENPLFGVGLNNFILANQQTIFSYQDLQPVHSMYLLFLSETGITGVFLLLLTISMLYKKIISASLYYLWPLGALLAFGLFDHYPLTIHQTLLLGGILTGFIVSTSQTVINLKHGKRSK